MWQYFKDVRSEMAHVSWPSRAQIIMYTIVVIVVSLATAVYLGVLDYLLAAAIQRFI